MGCLHYPNILNLTVSGSAVKQRAEFFSRLRHIVGCIVPPRRQKAVAVLVDDEGGEVVVLAAVFQAVLIVRKELMKSLQP